MYDYKVAGEFVEYVPSWENQRSNLKLDNTYEPVMFKLQLVTMKDSEEWSRRAFALRTPQGVGIDGETNEDEANLELSKQQIIAGISEIKNLKFNGNDIFSGEELWGTPYKDLILEVGRAIAQWSVLTAGDIQNLRLGHNGSSEEITTTAPTA